MNADIRSAFRLIVNAVIPGNYIRPAEWAELNIRFTEEKDPIRGALDLSFSPFLRDPINAWELETGQGLKEVTVVAPEQTGKSLSWMCGELWSLAHSPGLSLIYYTSDEKAAKINEEKIEPLLKNVPKFAELLALPNSKTADCYRLGDNLSYFAGVGARISSFSSRRSVADEIDDWLDKKGVNSLNDLRKRAWAFSEALLYKVCTPKGTEAKSRIWREFLASSQGYWYLRCTRCGCLTMRSCDVHNLQWELNAEGEIIESSIRLICPKCKQEHLEAEKRRMIQEGDYIHRHPERLKSHPGFQWGKLASLMKSAAWIEIAKAQMAAGKSGNLDDQILFDNSVRGRPFKARALDNSAREALKRHAAPLPAPAKILYRFLGVDTQDDCFYWVVRGMDGLQNTYYLASGKAMTTEELSAVWEARYHGDGLTCGIIDEGGHRADEVRDWARKYTGIFTYKGNPRIGCKYKLSEEVARLLLVNPALYHMALLHSLYASRNRGNYFWYVTEELPPDYEAQITCWQPNPGVKNGHEFENYHCPSGEDHYFDCEKELQALIDFFKACILPKLLFARQKVVRR